LPRFSQIAGSSASGVARRILVVIERSRADDRRDDERFHADRTRSLFAGSAKSQALFAPRGVAAHVFKVV
jgi:hypothetical protein